MTEINQTGQNKATTYVDGLTWVIERIFNAPRELVWDAWTKPEHVSKWWAPKEMTLSCEIDLREGGSYRYVQRDTAGNEYPFKGVYRKVVKPEILVYTQIFDVEPFSSNEAFVTDTFEVTADGMTKLISKSEFPSYEILQGALATGMESGAIDSMERFAEHLKTI